MTEMRLRRLASDEPANWPEALTQPATFTALDAWLNVVRHIYKYRVYRFETEIESDVTGLLALTHVKHPIFGNYLTTSPFGSYGGFAFASPEARDFLMTEARLLAAELGVEYINLRFDAGDDSPPPGWIQHPVYSTYRLDLNPDPEALLPTFSSDHRNHIRKSLKKGFIVKFGHLDLLDDAYEALSQSMHELGSPYHAKAYLRTMAEFLGDTLEFAVLYTPDGKLAGAGVFIFHGKVATNLHANILRNFRSDYAGEFLYWKVIERYCQKGYQVFDIGRSLLGSGNETFKMKWRPRKEMLAYWYALKPGAELPSLNQKNPKFAFAIATWKRLPAFLVRRLGPFLIRGLA
ncbi:MAG: GNAT family N-acetyltransferase [Chloroflexi bacterium]|nr:GNAT family N-acetyltransferase [Chloroflexota bacterium]